MSTPSNRHAVLTFPASPPSRSSPYHLWPPSLSSGARQRELNRTCRLLFSSLEIICGRLLSGLVPPAQSPSPLSPLFWPLFIIICYRASCPETINRAKTLFSFDSTVDNLSRLLPPFDLLLLFFFVYVHRTPRHPSGTSSSKG